MDAVLLARIQFAITVGFHFLFPAITIGLAWLLVGIEYCASFKKIPVYERIARLFAKLLGLTFAIGVASGIVMEFQFGTNWARYSIFVGDIFGAPLAAEALFAFFLESTFMGLYLFGRNRVSKGTHWFSILMVALGSTISAFWIIVANSWQQTPAGYALEGGRAVLTSFGDAVFNPSTLQRFFHTIAACFTASAFFMGGIAVIMLLKDRSSEVAQEALKISVVAGFIASIAVLFPTGHLHAKQVALTQPEKFAAIEGLIEGTTHAPMTIFGIPSDKPEPSISYKIEIPSLLSWFAYGSADAFVKGLKDFPPDERPPFSLTFITFHLMVALGLLFIVVSALGVFLLWTKRLNTSFWYHRLFLIVSPLPLIAAELGWITAEVGRQPWVVYKLLRTVDASSVTVTASEILLTMLLIGIIESFLLVAYIYFTLKIARSEVRK
mgnify:CR=1 FL=1